MIRNEEHLHNVFFFFLLNLILASFDVCFCVDSFYFLLTQFPLSISRNLILSVSFELRKVQLFHLAYRLAN